MAQATAGSDGPHAGGGARSEHGLGPTAANGPGGESGTGSGGASAPGAAGTPRDLTAKLRDGVRGLLGGPPTPAHLRDLLTAWPVYRQLTGHDPAGRDVGRDLLGRGPAVQSRRQIGLTPRIADADRVAHSVCPYCAVGCAQHVYVKDEQVVQIEGNPDSPVSRGRLCPKGSASLQLTTGQSRRYDVLYRRPHGTDWERLDLETALEMVADRVIKTRDETWTWSVPAGATGSGDSVGNGSGDARTASADGDPAATAHTEASGSDGDGGGVRVRRTLGIASLGGATLDNEENYLIKKLLTSLGVVQVENQARICHSSTVAGLGTSFGRGGGTTFLQDLQHSDCIVIQGSNFAEAHPVGFQWVMEAKARGAAVVHIDPRFSRTSALADVYVPLRAGTDIVWLGALISYVIENEKYFRDYVVNYTNAATLVSEDFTDTEDLDGVFSGLDASGGHYDSTSWSYEGVQVASASGEREHSFDGDSRGGTSVAESGHPESHGFGGPALRGVPPTDETLQHPRTVFQVLRRHFARYTPELVERVCGVPRERFLQVAELMTRNSGRDRTTAFCYAVGWTQHTVGVQYIRCASILQLLLGNIGRPGGGILALRGHASIQGSSDIPTLFDLLPGYIPMPHAHRHANFDDFVESDRADKGYWANLRAYAVSLMKAWWGEHATADNDWAFDYLPRLTGSHSTYETVMAQINGACKGYFLFGENPAVGSANTRMQRLGMSKLEWLVVRDFSLIESATWWKDGPEIESGEMRTQDIATEVFFFPAAAHTEKAGTFTNTNRMLQWREQAVEPKGEARSDLWFAYHLGRILRRKLAAAVEEAEQLFGEGDPRVAELRERHRPLLELTWAYPTSGPTAEPSGEDVLREINGWDADGAPLAGYDSLKDDGSTACGCWIYCGVFKDGVNQAARRKPWTEQNWTAQEWGWAWPANRRTIYSRASADPDGNPWSDRKALIWWDETAGESEGGGGRWVGHDIPDFPVDRSPHYRPDPDAQGVAALSGIDPFIMQSDGKGWLYAPAGLVDGPMPTHYEPQDSPVPNALYGQQRNPVRQVFSHPRNRYHPSGGEPGSEVFPYVVTTYRLTEHFTAGGMSRWVPYLAELQPELFCEVSPELAAERGLENGGWATLVTARNAIEARVLVTRRMVPLRVQGRWVHQIGMPYHWGPNGQAPGDATNELTAFALDANVHIQEVKAFSADIRPGRRPRGRDRTDLVADYVARAGIDERTGMGTRDSGVVVDVRSAEPRASITTEEQA